MLVLKPLETKIVSTITAGIGLKILSLALSLNPRKRENKNALRFLEGQLYTNCPGSKVDSQGP